MDNVILSMWYVLQIGTANFVVTESPEPLEDAQQIVFNGLLFTRGQFRVLYSGGFTEAMQYLNDITG